MSSRIDSAVQILHQKHIFVETRDAVRGCELLKYQNSSKFPVKPSNLELFHGK